MEPRSTSDYADLLSNVEIFAGLDRVTLAKLAMRLEPQPVSTNQTLMTQGEPAGDFFLVSRGTFGVFARQRDGAERRLATCSRGDPIGEMALLTDEPRSATVRADEEGEVLRLDQAKFRDLLRRDPTVATAIAATLSRRLRAANLAGGADPTLDGREPAPLAIVDTSALASPPVPAASSTRWRSWRPDRTLLGMVFAALIVSAGWIVPAPGLSVPSWQTLVTTVAFVVLIALEALPDGVASLALVGVWVVGGVVPAAVALSGYASPSWFLIVSIFIIGAAVAATGLLYRLALWAVARARTDFPAQVLALGIVGLFVGAAIPNSTARVSFVAPAVTEIADALGYAPRSRAAAGIAMAVLVGFGLMVAPFLTSSSTSLLVYAVLPPDVRASIDWATWTLRALPTHLLLLPGLLAAVMYLYRPTGGAAAVRLGRVPADALALQRALLGPLAPRERLAALVLAFMLAGFATQPLHRVEPAWVSVAGLTTLAAAGMVTPDALRAVNWNFVLLFGTLASTTQVFAATGLDRWLADLVAQAAEPLARAPVIFVAALTVLCFALSLVLRWQAAAPLLTLALAPVALAARIDPTIVAIVTLLACNGFFFAYQSTIYQALHQGTGGELFDHHQARPLALWYAVLTLLALCASVPVWHLMGLL